MTRADIDYHGIFWPMPHQASALHRAKELSNTDSSLSNLYEQVFAPEKLRLPAIPLPVSFSRDVHDQSQANRYFIDQPDLPLSIVTVTRNDDHVERMGERTQAFIDAIYYLAEKFQCKLELILVEWNPPADRAPLKEAFNFPGSHPLVSVVIVTVPRELHQTYQLADQLPLYQMIGKNVGIRRARGEFILSTNIDVLLSEELFEYITSPKLKKGHIYRSNRWDIDRNVLDLKDAETMLTNARELCFQINYPYATVSADTPPPAENPQIHYARYMQLPSLHTMACGDFQLLHREDWAKVRGFSELDTFSFHLDSLFALTCHFAGIEEINLGNDYPHYHIDHTLGTSVKGDTYVIEKKTAMKHLSMASLTNLVRNMEKQKDFFIFNKSNWGVAGTELPTERVTVASWDESKQPSQCLSTDSSKGSQPGFQLETANVDDQQKEHLDDILTSIVAATSRYLRAKEHSKNVHIWGTGHRAMVFGQYLQQQDIPIRSYLFSDGYEAPGTINDTATANATSLKNGASDFIVICSSYANDIICHLNEMNFREGEDYLVAF